MIATPPMPDGGADPVRDQHMALATVFAASLVLASLFLAVLLRHWFGSAGFTPAPTGYLRSLGLGLALMLLPYLSAERRHGVTSFAGLGVILAGLLVLRGQAMLLVDLICLLIVSVGAARLWPGLASLPHRWIAVMGGMGALAGAILVLAVQREFLLLGPEQAMLGLLHPDTLFHVAIAKLLENHGIVTVGLDGIVPTTYHVLSHRLIAGYGSWTGIDLLLAYGLFQYVIAVPVLLALLLQAAAQFFQPGPGGNLTPPAAVLSVYWWLALGGAIMWHSHYVSESYALGLWFVIFGAILLERLTLETRTTQRAALLVALALCIGLASLAKISVGAVLACGLAAGLAALSGCRPAGLVQAAVFALLPASAIYLAQPVASGGDAPMFKLFDFFRYEKPAAYALIFAGVMSYLAYRHWPADRRRQVMCLALLTGAYAGLGASYILNLPAGAHFYFSDPGTWMALMVIPLLGLAPKWLLRRPAPAQILWVAVSLAILLGLHERKLRGLDRVSDMTETAQALSPDGGLGPTLLTHTRLGSLWSAHAGEAFAFDAVHVAAEDLDFWNGHSRCWASSFVFPALFGRPMVAGIPPEAAQCEITPYYSFSGYDLAQSRATTGMTADALCLRAERHGFRSILWVTPDDARVLTCPVNAP